MTTFRRITLPATALAAALLLTGCTGGPPADGGSFSDVTALKDAFVKAGGTCDNWSTHNKSLLASSAGSCGDAYALSVYEDMDKRDQWVETMRTLNIGGTVAGKNWTISGTDAKPVHDKLGGELLDKK